MLTSAEVMTAVTVGRAIMPEAHPVSNEEGNARATIREAMKASPKIAKTKPERATK